MPLVSRGFFLEFHLIYINFHNHHHDWRSWFHNFILQLVQGYIYAFVLYAKEASFSLVLILSMITSSSYLHSILKHNKYWNCSNLDWWWSRDLCSKLANPNTSHLSGWPLYSTSSGWYAYWFQWKDLSLIPYVVGIVVHSIQIPEFDCIEWLTS